MSKELARSARALGRDMNFFGSKEKDFVIQTKGRVKINFGDKFIELFNGSKFTVGNSDAIKLLMENLLQLILMDSILMRILELYI